MKKLLTILTFALVAFSAKAQSCPDDNHPHMIDLGLPSGAKWACCNVGADKPEDCGGYYAWGETEEKFNYSPASYKYAYEVEDSNAYHHWDKKYYEFTEIGEDIACTQYDVANVTWGEEWQMPNLLRYEELGKNCSFEWGTINGIKGGLFTGPNGNSIFLPAAGYRYSSNGIAMVTSVNSMGYYWTANKANVSFMGNYLYCKTEMDPYMGLAVRLVYEPQVTVTTNVSPSGAGTVSGAGKYPKGSTVTLTATPANSDWEFDRFVRDYDNDWTSASRW